MEQRAVIKFNAKLGKSASETFRLMQQVYGSQCLDRTTVFEWHKRFLESRETLEDDKKSERPILVRTPEMIEKVRDFVANDRNASLKMMEEALNISRETIRTILHEDLEDWSLLHDNAPSHTSLIVRQCLARVSVLNHPPYSPDLAPCDFSLFPKLKLKLKGRFFDDIPTIQSACTQALEAISQIELEHAFESLLNRCNKCIEARGEYFE
ncbi:FLJ37770-like protein [Acromyrmex echinatior]|uniref:FLJ37770-like protein n=1 Tax=Acromyrmex echinatior TaxID=103372 RepID=F4WFJ2_ACREC|nr:FLJ37770-like protein [Acromyrmex echinatior]